MFQHKTTSSIHKMEKKKSQQIKEMYIKEPKGNLRAKNEIIKIFENH